jgi:hypothetical protein
MCITLPIFLLSASFGVQRACLRLKTLLPESSVPGLFLAASALVLPLVMLPVVVLVSQVASSPLLLIGVVALACSPLTYLVRAGVFVRPLLTPEDYRVARLSQLASRGLFVVGVFFLIIYAMTRQWPVPNSAAISHLVRQTVVDVSEGQEVELSTAGLMGHKTLLGFDRDTSFFRPWDWFILRWLVLEMLGRSLFTTVLIADLFVSVNSAVWRHAKRVASDPASGSYDRLMGSLERILNKS